MIKSIAEWIEDQAIELADTSLLVVGINLFTGHIPLKRTDNTDPPDESTLLLENAGGATVNDVKDRKDWALQVLSRAVNYTDARDNAHLVYNRLHQNTAQDLPVVAGAVSGASYVAMSIIAQNVPASIGQDEKKRWQFSTNYIVRIRNT